MGATLRDAQAPRPARRVVPRQAGEQTGRLVLFGLGSGTWIEEAKRGEAMATESNECGDGEIYARNERVFVDRSLIGAPVVKGEGTWDAYS